MSESLWNLKTLQDIKGPREAWGCRSVRTTNGLSGVEEATPYRVDERRLAREMRRDELCFRRQEEAVARSQGRLLAIRSRLKAAKEHNRALMAHRQQLLRARREKVTESSDAVGARRRSFAGGQMPEPDRSRPGHSVVIWY